MEQNDAEELVARAATKIEQLLRKRSAALEVRLTPLTATDCECEILRWSQYKILNNPLYTINRGGEKSICVGLHVVIFNWTFLKIKFPLWNRYYTVSMPVVNIGVAVKLRQKQPKVAESGNMANLDNNKPSEIRPAPIHFRSQL